MKEHAMHLILEIRYLLITRRLEQKGKNHKYFSFPSRFRVILLSEDSTMRYDTGTRAYAANVCHLPLSRVGGWAGVTSESTYTHK